LLGILLINWRREEERRHPSSAHFLLFCLAFYSGPLTLYLVCRHDTAHAMTRNTHTITNPADFIQSHKASIIEGIRTLVSSGRAKENGRGREKRDRASS